MADCRFCGAPLSRTFVDLGTSPPSNDYLRADQLDGMEAHFPLHVFICDACKLVQLRRLPSPGRDLQRQYAYFSSYSTAWLAHAERYCPHGHRALRARPAQPGGRGGQQRRLPACSYFHEARRAGARHRAGGERRRGRRSARASRRWCAFFGVELAQAAGGEGQPGRPASSATTCSPTCPTSTTSSPA